MVQFLGEFPFVAGMMESIFWVKSSGLGAMVDEIPVLPDA
jgi:hypothetical protein